MDEAANEDRRYARKDVEAEIAGAQEAAHKARVKGELRERLRHLVHH